MTDNTVKKGDLIDEPVCPEHDVDLDRPAQQHFKCPECGWTFKTCVTEVKYRALHDSPTEEDLLTKIRENDRDSANGGHYVQPERRVEAEKLVNEGKVVRVLNPAGVSPMYVPMDSDHYSDERLAKLRERQSAGQDNRP